MQTITKYQLVFATGFANVPFWRHADFTTTALTPAQSVTNVQEYMRFQLTKQILTSLGPVVNFEVTSAIPAVNATSTNLTVVVSYSREPELVAFTAAVNDATSTAFNYTIGTFEPISADETAVAVNYGFSAKHQVLASVNQVVYPALTTEAIIVMQTQDVVCPTLTPAITITVV